MRALGLRELWAYRELALFLALRELKARYKQAVFGAAWAVVQPLAGVVVFTIVFRRLANMPSDGLPYPLFAFAGLIAWTYISAAVTKGTQILVQNVPLVTKVYFPRILAPLAAAVPGLVDLVISAALLLALAPLFGVTPTWRLVTFPLWVLAALLVVLSVSTWLSALNVRYRDVNHAVTLLIQLWLFASPVAYPLSQVPDAWRQLYLLNPTVGIIEGFRWSMIGAPWPGTDVVISFTAGAVLLAGGLLYFQHNERRFADVI
ncbi:MAG: ABC transporter permease [Actinomycetota bacterium]|nr:ABC transporter permease [Actinomycetota bacterium]